jgi:hypothetical protein
MGNGDVAACRVPGSTMGILHGKGMKTIWNGLRHHELRRAADSQNPPAIRNARPMFKGRNNPESYLFHRESAREKTVPDAFNM